MIVPSSSFSLLLWLCAYHFLPPGRVFFCFLSMWRAFAGGLGCDSSPFFSLHSSDVQSISFLPTNNFLPPLVFFSRHCCGVHLLLDWEVPWSFPNKGPLHVFLSRANSNNNRVTASVRYSTPSTISPLLAWLIHVCTFSVTSILKS